MLLYLIRHAEAEDAPPGGRDFDRPLTPRGRAQARALAQAFLAKHLAVDAIAVSPLVRAYQTAVELLGVLAPGMRPVTCDLLAIDRLKPSHLSDFLTRLPATGDRVPTREEKAVVAIGHMPDLAQFAEWLIGASPGTIHFAKAGAACIKFPDAPIRASGELEWLISPDWL